MKKIYVASLLSALSFGAAAADISAHGSLGTQGVGAGLSLPLGESSAVRLELNTLRFSRNFTEDQINYNGRLKNNSIAALYDWHLSPASSFRFTGGVVFNDGGFSASGTTTTGGTFTVGGTTVTAGAGERVDVDADFKKVSPYIGIGWGKTAGGKGFSFFGDLGAFYAKPDVTLTLTPVLQAGVNASDPTAIARETAKLQDNMDSLRWYPVLRVGVRYAF
jgi:hypothetical protein